MGRKHYWPTALIAVLALAAGGASADAVKVGVVMGLAGHRPSSTLAKIYLQGMKLALKDYSATGGSARLNLSSTTTKPILKKRFPWSNG